MMTTAEKRGWDTIDTEAVKAGGYLAIPKYPLIIEYDYRAMTEYCRERGMSKMDLNEDELKLFEFEEPLVYASK